MSDGPIRHHAEQGDADGEAVVSCTDLSAFMQETQGAR